LLEMVEMTEYAKVKAKTWAADNSKE
jgi:hypothetical protein